MEKVVVILDLRQEFLPFLSAAKTSVKTFVHEKLVHKPTSELGLLGFGSLETSTAGGTREEEGQIIISPFEEVSLNALQQINDIADNVGGVPLSSSLRKAADMISGGLKKKTAKKRVVVLSTFAGFPEHEQEACESALTIITADGISCEFVVCADESTEREANGWVDKLSSDKVAIRLVCNGYELETCFPTKENKDAHVIYSGLLEIECDVGLDIKIVPKVKKEGFPAMGNTTGESYNESFSYNWSYPTTPAGKSDELFREDDIDQLHPVSVEKRVRGFKFGKSLVPLSGPLLEVAKIPTDRNVRLLGFLDEADVRPDLFLGTSKILFADKGKISSIRALHSLVRAMINMKKVSLLRVVLRAGSNTKIMIGFPGKGNPAYLILKEAPFMEDIAFLNVAPLPESSVQYHARTLVDDNMLAESDMVLDRTSNPILHRAISHFTDKFLDIHTKDALDNSWLQNVFGSDIIDIINSSHI